MKKPTINLEKFWYTWNVAIILATFKLLLHFLTNTNYGFHRDEFLYLAQAEHLAWGYMEVPPMIAVPGKMALSLGGSLFMVRLFPALIGGLIVFLIAVMVRDLGGKKWAQALACLAFILSPAFLRVNTLFQPVSFNQLWWFLSTFFIIRLIKYQNPKYWYYLGMVAGVGFLTKYSIAFFYTAFFIAILLTPHRKWLKTKYPYLAMGMAFLIAFPNLIWQYQHNWPVVHHLTELSQSQLVHIEALGFLETQFTMLHAALIVWLPGLMYLFFSSRLSDYRILGWIYLGIILLLALLSGKSYYSLGAYPMLMAAGGVAIEDFLATRSGNLKYILIFLLFVVTLPILPYGLPVLPIDKMKNFCAYMKDHFGMDGPLRWEDGKIYSLPQDFADMHGWEEMAAKVSCFYNSLSPDEQNSCMLYTFNYGYAGSINYYRNKYNLPEAYSLYSSFLMCAPDSVNFDRQILVDEFVYDASSWFDQVQLVDSLRIPHSRLKGKLYYRTHPKTDIKRRWTELVRERKKEFDF